MLRMSVSRMILTNQELKARGDGASKVYVEDLKEDIVTHYIFPVIKANRALRGRYLLGTSP